MSPSSHGLWGGHALLLSTGAAGTRNPLFGFRSDTGLGSHPQDTYVGGVEVAYAVVIEGGLSSGERRRLQVCATLISKPEVVILDEPTTGLDATNALHLVRVLKRLCRDTSMTAIASLHQCRREIMTELDGALLLCKGRMVYSGACGRGAQLGMII